MKAAPYQKYGAAETPVSWFYYAAGPSSSTHLASI